MKTNTIKKALLTVAAVVLGTFAITGNTSYSRIQP